MLRVGTNVHLTKLSSSERLTPHRSKIKYGDRAFVNAAPTLWNKLPSNIKAAKSIDQFKRLLKSWLFETNYHV
jgi:hypothetical protein